MKPIEEVNTLLAAIEAYRKRITEIQDGCKHKTLRHTRMIRYIGYQDVRTDCLDCGAFISCYTMPLTADQEAVEDSRVEIKPD